MHCLAVQVRNWWHKLRLLCVREAFDSVSIIPRRTVPGGLERRLRRLVAFGLLSSLAETLVRLFAN